MANLQIVRASSAQRIEAGERGAESKGIETRPSIEASYRPYLGVYVLQSRDCPAYYFFAGECAFLPSHKEIHGELRERIALKSIPSPWMAKELGQFLDEEGRGIQPVGIGSIHYKIQRKDGLTIAIADLYYPRRPFVLNRRSITLLDPFEVSGIHQTLSRFPYYLEAIAVNHLRKPVESEDCRRDGIDLISTSEGISTRRFSQLRREEVKLPVHAESNIWEWIRGLGRGTRAYVREYLESHVSLNDGFSDKLHVELNDSTTIQMSPMQA